MRIRKVAAKNQETAAIGLRLKNLRKQSGLSLSDVADRLNREFGANANKGMISKYENGIHEPSAGTVFCLAKVLGVSADYLMGKSDVPDLSDTKQGSELQGRVIKIYTRFNPIDGGECETESVELIPQAWLMGGREFFGIRIQDGSLAPRYYDGDVVIFERRGKMDHDRVGLVSIADGDAFICLILKKRNGKWIKPLDPEKQDVFYTTEQLAEIPVRILGAAVQVRRMEYQL